MDLSCTCYQPPDGSIGDDDHPPVIFLHGLFGSKVEWDAIAKETSSRKRIKVYALDARNHGESPHSEEHDITSMASDLEHFMKMKDIEKAVVVGHSMGGRTAMRLALAKPEAVVKLVVEDVRPNARLQMEFAIITKFMTTMRLILDDIPEGVSLEEARERANRHLLDIIQDENVRQQIVSNNLLQDENGIYKWRANLKALESRIRDYLTLPPSTPYDGPVLFICGRMSGIITETDESEIRQIFPKAEFNYIDDAGHWVHVEKRDEFVKALVSFL